MELYGYIDKNSHSWDYDYESFGKLEDIRKTLTYLSGDGLDNNEKSMRDILTEIRDEDGRTKNIDLGYFSITFYKKGTAHITFTNLELLKKLNLFGCQKKGWLPPSYGKKNYSDFTPEEKNVVDEYEGEKSYGEVMENQQYYLSGSTLELTSDLK